MNARRHRSVLSRTAVSGAVLAGVVAGAVLGGSAPASAAVTRPLAAASAPTQTQPSTQPQTRTPGAGRHRVVVRVGAARRADVVRAAERVGGRLVAVQPGLGTLVLDLPAGADSAVATVPGAVVAADRAVRPLSLGFDPSGQPGSMTSITRLTGAQSLWRKGYTGAGIDVALIDTGVAPVDALDDADKVVVGPDLSIDSQAPNLRNLDVYGHGTHMAGIIAGREGGLRTGSQYVATAGDDYLGMAPDARVVSVKVAATDGAVDVSQLIAAIDWVVQHRASDGLNIRVLNLSLGTESVQDPALDPLAWAAENAWHAGIVVVASAGNSGGRVAGLDDPASNPWVIAVGAADTQGTDGLTDDDVPSFSARPAANALRGIDLVAPGVRIVGPGVGGSNLYSKAEKTAKLGNGFLRGSGTSQAAAVVSGAVALMLDQRPSLTPDQVKLALRATAVPLSAAAPEVQGSGELNLVGASTYRVPLPRRAAQRLPWGTGTGSLEAARGGAHLVLGGTPLTGEQDIFGQPWNSADLADAARYDSAWSPDGWFNGSDWTGTGFVADTSNAAGLTWLGRTWSGSTWSGSTWSGSTWSGSTWSGSTWSGSTWSGSTWSGSTWSSRTWSGSTWTGSTWTGTTWSGGIWSGEVWQGKKWT